MEYIIDYINKFIKFAKENKDLIFLVTEIGCGYAGYKPKDIAPLFKQCEYLENVYLPQRFWDNLNLHITEELYTISGIDTDPFCRYSGKIPLIEFKNKLNNLYDEYTNKNYFNLNLKIKENSGLIDVELYGDRLMNNKELKDKERMEVIFRMKEQTSEGLKREDLI